ncbi:MAG: S8 family serine peptidase [Gemmatimonadota bacterium]|nr:S8 family serine peptidase [Gemmatimonadota bacterium]MDH5282779.1 S8 family serine peptidase [Gemmatimonadota bacterium]
MKLQARIALASTLAFVGAGCADRMSEPVDPSAQAVSAQAPAEPVMPGEVLVKFRPGADAAAVLGGHGLALQERGYRDAFVIARGGVGMERAAVVALRGDARVEWAEPNYLRQTTAINPNLWAFYNPGGLNMKYTTGKNSGKFIASSYASIADADEDNIEGYATGGADILIGSIDTGVDLLHPEFTGRLIAGKDWYNNDNDPTDDDGHGSHTTGTMAGSTVGVAGVSGAASHVKVYVQKVCGRRGCPTSAIVNAIRAAADQPGMVAMNLSLGGSSESQAEKDAIAYAVTTKNVLVIASAGNSGSGTVACPACDPLAISVAATTWRDERASYSQYGPGLDISAPGGQCYSNTTPEGCIYSAYKGGTYAWLQGTSMAAPQVTGTAGIVASKTGLRGAGLRGRLESTADDKGATGYDQTFGNGRLNSYKAVTNTALGAGL